MSENQAIESGYPRPDDSLKKRIWVRMIPLEQRTLLGTVFFLIVLLTMGWIGLNEQARMTEYDKQYVARAIQRGAGIYDSTCSVCHGKSGEGKPGIAPTLNRPEEFNGRRLKELGYAGTLRDYFTLTISAGRPAKSNSSWPQPMPTWSQDYGGPLRPDQIQDVVSFVMNWGCGYNSKYDTVCMGQDVAFNPTSLPTESFTPTPSPTPVPITLSDIIASMVDGDATVGQAIYKGTTPLADGGPAGCNACHSIDGSTVIGPSFQGIASRTPPSDWPIPPDVTASNGDTQLAYLIQSIYQPDAYKAHGFEGAQMLLTFQQRMSPGPDYKDLADVIAYLKTLK